MTLLIGMLLACSAQKDQGAVDSAADSAVEESADTAGDTAGDSAAARPVAGDVGTLVADAQAADDVLYHPDGFLVASDLLGDGTLNNPTGTVLRRITLDGEAGSADGPAAEAQLQNPNGIAASPDGRTLYIQELGGALRTLTIEAGA